MGVRLIPCAAPECDSAWCSLPTRDLVWSGSNQTLRIEIVPIAKLRSSTRLILTSCVVHNPLYIDATNRKVAHLYGIFVREVRLIVWDSRSKVPLTSNTLPSFRHLLPFYYYQLIRVKYASKGRRLSSSTQVSLTRDYSSSCDTVLHITTCCVLASCLTARCASR